MNTSYLEIARASRVIALDTLRRKKNVSVSEDGDVLCLQSMRQKRQAKPVFKSSRIHRFEERLAA